MTHSNQNLNSAKMPPKTARTQGTPLIRTGSWATQAFTLAEQPSRVVAVAGVLEKTADGPEEAVKRAHVATEIKAEASRNASFSNPESASSRLSEAFSSNVLEPLAFSAIKPPI